MYKKELLLREKELKNMLEINKINTNKALGELDENKLYKTFKEYDILFNELLKVQQEIVLE